MVRISPRSTVSPRSGCGSGTKQWIVRLLFCTSLATICFFQLNQRYRQATGRARGSDSRQTVASLRAPSYSSLRTNSESELEQCRFYLAESAIPMSGLGLFTAIAIAEGEQAQSMADICIYVADTPEGTHFETHSWARDVWFGTFEGRNPRAACEGFATLFNSMPPGVQTSKLKMLHPHDNANLRRDRDPGAGAISHYSGVTSIATRDIAAGSELTIDYGDWHYDKPREAYKVPSRNPDWLRKHGMCIDNIRIQPATDPSMGRGAFAAYNLQQGERVAPAPLQVFDARDFGQESQLAPLFVNYCLSIPGTSLLLFPYGPGVNMVNHAPSPNQVNVKFQWSTHPMNHAAWLHLPLDQMLQMDYPGGLMLDLVTTRPIAAGEELFLDYGTAWQNAWERHIRDWHPVPNASLYKYASEFDRTQPFPTVSELQEQKSTSTSQASQKSANNLHTVCWTPNWSRDEPFKPMAWIKPEFEWPEGLIWCNLHERRFNEHTQEYEYDVSLNFHTMDPDRIDKSKYIDTGVPQSAIFYVDKPYLSDLHLPNAFRHSLELSEELVPEMWLASRDEPQHTNK